jgi:hypothetical protein
MAELTCNDRKQDKVPVPQSLANDRDGSEVTLVDQAGE